MIHWNLLVEGPETELPETLIAADVSDCVIHGSAFLPLYS